MRLYFIRCLAKQWRWVVAGGIGLKLMPSIFCFRVTELPISVRFKIPEWKWEEAKKRFPSLLQKVNQKRLRRMEYALETGKFPPQGWTPPDPENRSTQNVPPYASSWKH